jgi:hypothetical protein
MSVGGIHATITWKYKTQQRASPQCSETTFVEVTKDGKTSRKNVWYKVIQQRAKSANRRKKILTFVFASFLAKSGLAVAKATANINNNIVCFIPVMVALRISFLLSIDCSVDVDGLQCTDSRLVSLTGLEALFALVVDGS